ncbi:MAG TPA: DMT family transporter [Lichenihabitans sp.]|jgi:drug/metabolite transporter (DMT)-like permease|nr:DMT family transporter [Lichenihabitans sp.]
MVFTAGVLYSTAGLFTRALPYDAWTILAWRAAFGALFTLGWLIARDGRAAWRAFAFDAVQWATLPLIAVAGIFYIFALEITTVADVMVVYATVPFMTAAVAWLWGREVPSTRMLVASFAALGGIVVMMIGSAGSGHRLAGIGLTLLMNVAFATILVGARRHPGSTPAQFTVGTLINALVAFVLAPAEPVSAGGIGMMALFGVLTIGLAMALFMAGARLIPPAEVGLIGIVDVVIGPLLVWIAFGEDPGLAAELGGSVVLAALVWHLWPEVRSAGRSRRKAEFVGPEG